MKPLSQPAHSSIPFSSDMSCTMRPSFFPAAIESRAYSTASHSSGSAADECVNVVAGEIAHHQIQPGRPGLNTARLTFTRGSPTTRMARILS
jgi:hypothetical protein